MSLLNLLMAQICPKSASFGYKEVKQKALVAFLEMQKTSGLAEVEEIQGDNCRNYQIIQVCAHYLIMIFFPIKATREAPLNTKAA